MTERNVILGEIDSPELVMLFEIPQRERVMALPAAAISSVFPDDR